MLISALNSFKSYNDVQDIFYNIVVSECIRKKDRKALLLLPKISLKHLQEAIKILLDPLDEQGIKHAYAIANAHSNDKKGTLVLLDIYDCIIKLKSQYEVAVDVLNAVKFLSSIGNSEKKAYHERICKAVDQLTRILVDKEMFEYAEKAIKICPGGNEKEFRISSPLRELGEDIYKKAMDKKKYSLAFEAASFPLFYKFIFSKWDKDPIYVQSRETAVSRIKEIHKLVPQGDVSEKIEQILDDVKKGNI